MQYFFGTAGHPKITKAKSVAYIVAYVRCMATTLQLSSVASSRASRWSRIRITFWNVKMCGPQLDHVALILLRKIGTSKRVETFCTKHLDLLHMTPANIFSLTLVRCWMLLAFGKTIFPQSNDSRCKLSVIGNHVFCYFWDA